MLKSELSLVYLVLEGLLFGFGVGVFILVFIYYLKQVRRKRWLSMAEKK